jgi:hypothetical protein
MRVGEVRKPVKARAGSVGDVAAGGVVLELL